MAKKVEYVLAKSCSSTAAIMNGSNFLPITKESETEAILPRDAFLMAPRHLLGDSQEPGQILGYQQMTVYILITSVIGGVEKVLLYRRAPKGGESRLKGKLSIGIGGHVSEPDIAFDQTEEGEFDEFKKELCPMSSLLSACWREFIEEIRVKTPGMFGPVATNLTNSLIPIGIIADETTDVERCHVGFVYKATIDESLVSELEANDEGIDLIGFVSKDEIKNQDGQIEVWSQILLDKYLQW
jgi:predicted NUDIX family phosphoesterase